MKQTNDMLKALGIKYYDIPYNSAYVSLPILDPFLVINLFKQNIKEDVFVPFNAITPGYSFIEVDIKGRRVHPVIFKEVDGEYVFLYYKGMLPYISHIVKDLAFITEKIEEFLSEVDTTVRHIATTPWKIEDVVPVKSKDTVTVTVQPPLFPEVITLAPPPINKQVLDPHAQVEYPKHIGREYEADITKVVDVPIAWNNKSWSITSVLNTMRKYGYDSTKYGTKPIESLNAINCALAEERLIELMSNGRQQRATPEGEGCGFGSFETQGNTYFNICHPMGFETLNKVLLDHGFAVQKGVHYRLVVMTQGTVWIG